MVVRKVGFFFVFFFFFSSRRRHTRSDRDWSSDVCSSDLWLLSPRLARSKWRCWLNVLAPSASPASNLHSPARDRKSTRLNSSHDQISYAVFCLKKKNTPTLALLETQNTFTPAHVTDCVRS